MSAAAGADRRRQNGPEPPSEAVSSTLLAEVLKLSGTEGPLLCRYIRQIAPSVNTPT